jgi:hypothetical protein
MTDQLDRTRTSCFNFSSIYGPSPFNVNDLSMLQCTINIKSKNAMYKFDASNRNLNYNGHWAHELDVYLHLPGSIHKIVRYKCLIVRRIVQRRVKERSDICRYHGKA